MSQTYENRTFSYLVERSVGFLATWRACLPELHEQNVALSFLRNLARPPCSLRALSGSVGGAASWIRWVSSSRAERRGVRFFTGLHQPSDAKHFDAAFVSVNRLRKRKSAMNIGNWIMDSGAFTEISTHGRYRHDVASYAAEIRRWATNGSGQLLAAVAQDWMCEPFIVEKTGLSIAEHQRLTIERYDALMREDVGGTYVLPVLQGFAPEDYAAHVHAYGDRLALGAWVGVGSVCKRNGTPAAVAAVLLAVLTERPDLRLHGFGLKTTALANPLIRRLLHTADSMAWSFSARKQGRNANDWREARRWTEKIHTHMCEGFA